MFRELFMVCAGTGIIASIVAAANNETIVCALRPSGYTCNKLREENGSIYRSDFASNVETLLDRDRTGAGQLVKDFTAHTLDNTDPQASLVQDCNTRVEAEYANKDTSAYNYLEWVKKQDLFVCVRDGLSQNKL